MIHGTQSGHFYRMKVQLREATLRRFVQNFLRGQLRHTGVAGKQGGSGGGGGGR